MQLFKKLNAESTTIIQVTHSETNAANQTMPLKSSIAIQ